MDRTTASLSLIPFSSYSAMIPFLRSHFHTQRCIAVYDRPFWRDSPATHNLTFVLNPDTKGSVDNIYDITPPPGVGNSNSSVCHSGRA